MIETTETTHQPKCLPCTQQVKVNQELPWLTSSQANKPGQIGIMLGELSVVSSS